MSFNLSFPLISTSQTSDDEHIKNTSHITIIGGGFTGLTAAYELTRQGFRVTVLERDSEVGGLAGSFQVNGEKLEKFYHHWFTNDQHVMNLVKELEAEDQVVYRPTRTGIYYANNFFKLSSPLDLLNFKPLNWFNRIRLGLFALWARRIKNWQKLESLTAKEWLLTVCGKQVYQVVWEPLLRGKFGPFAETVSAVWFWNKVKLRGGSRAKDGAEMLAYYRGGFAALAQRLADSIAFRGGEIKTNTTVEGLIVKNGRVIGVKTANEMIETDAVIATPALPIIADLIDPYVPPEYSDKLRQIQYLANVCLVLQLNQSLSKTYWLNVNDPNFPFVGVIEHTNFEPKETYGGRHIVYLSKYLPETEELYQMNDQEALNYAIPYIQRMFPEFSRDWIIDYHFWRAHYSQPIVVRHYSQLIPKSTTPLNGFYVSTMAQIYPEDRGTNYAIREGKKIANVLTKNLKK
ncbi:NAD(P)/FAD-dependent oxidoreductase [Aphanothece sacrum]|uniref:Amine oxidase n=1 Tax=Aphanothece sacrum FPU1 TaxID=1920663 RepID=A0A401IBX8_APHSA|nr:NAD(P)/FAD-dependent oxidoreductase [Aphanothece sacrum]GBF78724.1 amine oxidase [Aphanothece sacrum FPU1]